MNPIERYRTPASATGGTLQLREAKTAPTLEPYFPISHSRHMKSLQHAVPVSHGPVVADYSRVHGASGRVSVATPIFELSRPSNRKGPQVALQRLIEDPPDVSLLAPH